MTDPILPALQSLHNGLDRRGFNLLRLRPISALVR